MKVSTKNSILSVAKDTDSERIKSDGKVFYRFETNSSLSDYIDISWQYIKKHKDSFNITKGE